MRQKSGPEKQPAEDAIRDIRRATRRHFSAEEKIRIVLEGLRGEESIAELCRREGIASSMYYGWSKEFLEAGKRRLAGDTARAACVWQLLAPSLNPDDVDLLDYVIFCTASICFFVGSKAAVYDRSRQLGDLLVAIESVKDALLNCFC